MNKKLTVEIGDPILVEWLDSSHFTRWHAPEELRERVGDSLKCSSVGYAFDIREDRVAVVMNKSWEDDAMTKPHNVAEVTVIPRQAIVNIRKLK